MVEGTEVAEELNTKREMAMFIKWINDSQKPDLLAADNP